MNLEPRYFVFKVSDLNDAQQSMQISAFDIRRLHMINGAINQERIARGKTPFGGVVIESDWPEYAPVVAAINRRINGQPAELGFETVGWQFKCSNGKWIGLLDEQGKNQAISEGCEVREVYSGTNAFTEREGIRKAHAAWSQSTFGNVGPIGPLKHLSKEALEAAAQPDDLSEWADIQFLLWDAQRRAGITDEQITQAMIEKLKVNMARQWPEPKDGEPRLHINKEA